MTPSETSTSIQPEIIAALIAVGGVVVAGIIQWLVTLLVVRSERQKLRQQLSDEFRYKHFSSWQERFQDLIVKLLAATDMEATPPYDRGAIIPLVHALQLMLDLRVPQHETVNALVNELALTANGWKGKPDVRTVLELQNRLLKASREAMFLSSKAHVA